MAKKARKLMALVMVLAILVAQLVMPAAATETKVRIDGGQAVEGIARVDTSLTSSIEYYVCYILDLFFGWLGIDLSPIIYPNLNPEFVAADNEATNVLAN